jgi:hypothetical protein
MEKGMMFIISGLNPITELCQPLSKYEFQNVPVSFTIQYNMQMVVCSKSPCHKR